MTLLKRLAAREGKATTSEEIWASSPVPVGMAEREITKALKLVKATMSVARSVIPDSSPGLLAKDVAKARRQIRLR
jgi:hypothetical protein